MSLAEEKHKGEKNALLIEAYQGGDNAALETLVCENIGLVKNIARRFYGRGTEYEDIVQIGTIGMIKAAKSFDAAKGTVFSTYAVPLIIGEIRRHLRDEGPIKVSRIYKRQGMILMCEKNRIAAEEGRDVGIAELAARCGVSVEEAAVSLDAMSPVTSLSDFVYGEDTVTYENVIPDEESEHESERICDKIALTQCIQRLPELWQKIVLMRYFRNMTQQQTANALGLTQVKISREEKKLLAALREELSP